MTPANHFGHRLLAHCCALCLLLLWCLPAQASVEAARARMENIDNPLLHVSTSLGELYIELFPRSAPRNVERLLALVEAEQVIMLPESIEPLYYHYFDGQGITRNVDNHFVIIGDNAALSAAEPLSPVAHEINASRLGLDQQPVMLADGHLHPWLNLADHADFQQRVLAPLYQSLGINNQAQLSLRMDAVQRNLRSMTLAELYTLKGYRYDPDLPSRMPLTGSVVMLPDGVDGNRDSFFINLLDAPWLMGKNTVVGQLIDGLEITRRIEQAVTAGQRVTVQQIREVNRNTADADTISGGE